MTDHTGFWNLDKKMKVFGISVSHFKEEIKKYPKVRISIVGSDCKYKWCQEELGNNWIWSSQASTNYVDMYFLHKDDAIIFKLKFGEIEKIIAY